ncbi:MAG TPA: hypothetical protein VFE45_15550, partial [Coriobacteriia bacterium]|nr:hypothetical protein [Coriobacteriia bacterium]
MAVSERQARKRKGRQLALFTVLAAVALTVAASQVSGWIQWRSFVRGVDGILTATCESETQPVLFGFRFGGRHHLVQVAISASEVERSRRVRTADIFRLGKAERDRYFRHLILATSRSGAVRAFADELRAIRRQRRLDGDEYLELIARAVQEIPYGIAINEFQLPAEVLASRRGVCSEKSVLLAALLTREGYDTALIILDAEGHVAVGVG